jgi:hypothetical protein
MGENRPKSREIPGKTGETAFGIGRAIGRRRPGWKSETRWEDDAMTKLIAMLGSGLVGLGLAGLYEPVPDPQRDDGPAKKKGEPGKKGAEELTKAYNLLRRLKADDDKGDRLRDWTDRAAKLYRRAVDAARNGDPRREAELALAAHDLARAVDHSRNASRSDRSDPDLPPPPGRDGFGDDRGPLRKDLRKAYDRIVDLGEGRDAPDARFYRDAARDLYNAARRDVEAGRPERAGELARAAEAMTHVPEHLARAEGRETDDGPEPKANRDLEKAKGSDRAKEDRPGPKAKHDRDDIDDLPPPLPR